MYPPYCLKKSFILYQDKLSLDGLCENINSLNYLQDKLDLISEIGWEKLCLNKNPQVIVLLEANISKLNNKCWDILGSKHSHPDLFTLVENNISLIPSCTWRLIASNPNPISIVLIEKNLDKLNKQGWVNLIQNEQAMGIIENNFFIIENNNYWEYLCSHKQGIDLIIKNKKINYLNDRCWKSILQNYHHYQLILENLGKVYLKSNVMWEYICLNSHPEIVTLISKNLSRINNLYNADTCWENICLNSGAVNIIKDNFDFLYQKGLLVFISQNEHASEILEEHLDTILQFKNLKYVIPNLVSNYYHNKPILQKIFSHPTRRNYSGDIWMYLCRCENLIELIEDNFEFISKNQFSMYDLCGNKFAMSIVEKYLSSFQYEWYQLSENPSIFEPDYHFLKNHIQLFQEQLISTVFHPQKMIYFLEKYKYDIGEEDYLDQEI